MKCSWNSSNISSTRGPCFTCRMSQANAGGLQMQNDNKETQKMITNRCKMTTQSCNPTTKRSLKKCTRTQNTQVTTKWLQRVADDYRDITTKRCKMTTDKKKNYKVTTKRHKWVVPFLVVLHLHQCVCLTPEWEVGGLFTCCTGTHCLIICLC